VVADQSNLYGFSMVGDTIAPDVPETYTLAPLNPVPTTNPTAIPATTVTTTGGGVFPVTSATTVSVKATTYSPFDSLILLPALAAALLLIRMRR
jgi:hypothetical protein